MNEITLTVKSRARLAEFIEQSKCEVAAQLAHYRSGGAEARERGYVIADCPWHPGSWIGVRWLEGFSGTLAPYRDYVDGAWTSTPIEDVASFADWIMALGMPGESATLYIAARRAGYTPAALGMVQ